MTTENIIKQIEETLGLDDAFKLKQPRWEKIVDDAEIENEEVNVIQDKSLVAEPDKKD